MSFLLILACLGPVNNIVEPVPEPGVEAVLEPTPYVVVDEASEVEPLTPEVLAVGITQAIDSLLHVDPVPFHEKYEGLREGMDDGYCPYYYPDYYEDYGQYYWIDSCSSDMGGNFAGNGRSYLLEPYVNDEYEYEHVGYFYGSARIEGADGEVMSAAGYSSAQEYRHSGNGYTYYYHDMWGEFSAENLGLEDTWLTTNWRLDHTLSANISPEGGKYIYLNSALSNMEGPINAAVLEGVMVYDALRGSPCPQEPSGLFSLRDSEGRWYEVEFDGLPSGGTAMYPPDCDGCGEAWLDGVSVGTVCPDFSALLDWEGRPWK